MGNFYEDLGYQRVPIKAKLMFDNKFVGKTSAAKKDSDGSIPEELNMDDLLYVKFLLVSEHENTNGDYTPRSEIIKAYQTSSHKPFNIEHELEEDGSYISEALFNSTRNTIIGHMVSANLADNEGNILSEKAIAKLSTEDDPTRSEDEKIDVVASAVLYKMCFPKTCADIEEQIEDEEMFVSMEAWFKDFDFLVGDEIVKRTKANEDEYIESWHSGEKVNGRRVSRVLRHMLFGGVAATGKPANKRSIFLQSGNKKTIASLKKRHDELHILYKHMPSQELVKEHEEVTKIIASLNA